MPASIKHLKSFFKDDNSSMVLLSRWPKNKQFYQVTLLKLDEKLMRCYIRYQDGHLCWADSSNVHIQFNSDEPYSDDIDIVCCVCDEETSEAPNEIVICETCQQGYHRECHEPKITQAETDDASEWTCETCSYIMSQFVKKEKAKIESKPVSKKTVSKQRKQSNIIKLPRVKSAKKEELKQELSKEDVGTNDDEDIVEPPPGDSSEDSILEMPVEKLPNGACLDGENKIVKAAQALVENVGTEDFVEAISSEKTVSKRAKKKVADKASKKTGSKAKRVPKIPPPA